MQSAIGEIKVFAANANQELAKSIVDHLGIEMGKSVAQKFEDGECDIRINETVRGMDIFIVQSTAGSQGKDGAPGNTVNDNLMELLIMIDAMRRSSAGRITAVIPYFGYARQDRRDRSHAPISAKLVADMITEAGADRILSMDLHSPQIQGFFNIPFDHLSGVYTFINYYKDKGYDLKKDYVVVSPDFGSVTRCNIFAEALEIPLAITEKRRDENGKPYVANFIGDVKGKQVILLDDVLSSGNSLIQVAKKLKEEGAESIYACVTHPMLSGDAVENLVNSPICEIIVLDTIEIPRYKYNPKLTRLSVAELFSKAIRGIHDHESIGRFSRNSKGALLKD
ncbi:MAG: ribose-phosphate pyrophosphokinase [Defluviitaleaceae bacterium]|nr:ribose-phosphate pyrophosphokinase [Defluviitaleaceae bacterium]